MPRPRVIYENPDVSYAQPYDWSPDGRLLAIEPQHEDALEPA